VSLDRFGSNSKFYSTPFNCNSNEWVVDSLPSVFHKDRRFDRIDASNIADEAYLGVLQTLEACSPLVKYKSENPHATILTSFMLCTPWSTLAVKKLGL